MRAGGGSSPSTASTSPAHVTGAGAEPQQVVRAARELRGDLAGDGEHLASLLEREVGGDQRAAPLARLDDDRRERQARDDPVARREPPRRGLDARRVLGDDQPVARDLARRAPRERAGSRGRCRSRARRRSSPSRARRGAPPRRRRARGPRRRPRRPRRARAPACVRPTRRRPSSARAPTTATRRRARAAPGRRRRGRRARAADRGSRAAGAGNAGSPLRPTQR